MTGVLTRKGNYDIDMYRRKTMYEHREKMATYKLRKRDLRRNRSCQPKPCLRPLAPEL